jgi:glycosyltransferase involved in cell wall biosynthesis
MSAYLETAQSSRARLVLDAHNVEALLQDQIAEAAGSPVEIAIRRHFAQRTRLLEADTIGAVDAVWACSPRDQKLICTTYPAPRVDVVPNGLVISDYDEIFSARGTGPTAAPTIVFPAQFGYPPNRRGADWLLSEIAPAIRLRVPGVTFAMPGRDPSPHMMEAAAAGEALVPGVVPSMLPFLANADLMVVPLREGSGTRLKILEAFASGIPLISTAKGVEGLNVIAGEHYLQAETPDEFANAVVTLAKGTVVDTFRRNGRSFVEAGFSEDAVIAAVDDAVTALLT